MGAQSTLMYRSNLPVGDNYTIVHPEWAEWESELPYNKSRTCTFHRGSLSVFQVWGGCPMGVPLSVPQVMLSLQ